MNHQIIDASTSRPHNAHHLARYLRFVSLRVGREMSGYTELHHILPRAKDMFPEYGNLSDHPWNGIRLTAKEHILAHVMLWKSYGGSLAYALSYMLRIIDHKNNTVAKSDRIPPAKLLRTYDILRNDLAAWQRGSAKYKDRHGNIFTLSVDDPRIKAEGLVGFRKGIPHTDIAKERQSLAKAYKTARRKVILNFLDCAVTVRFNSPHFVDFLEQGWTMDKTEEDKEYTKALKDAKSSASLKGMVRYSTPDGKYFGRMAPTDPRIAEFELVPQVTLAQQTIGRAHAYLMAAGNIGTTIYNDGSREIKRKTHPGRDWVEGRLVRSTDHHAAQRAGVREATLGTVFWNDGARNYRLRPGDVPDAAWKKGMAPRREK